MKDHFIENYRFGEITIDGNKYHDDVIILPDRILDSWWRDRGHFLQLGDLDAVLQAQPEALVIGQGANSRMQVPDEILKEIQQRGIEVYSLPTHEACDKYNQLNEEKNTAAAFHLTC